MSSIASRGLTVGVNAASSRRRVAGRSLTVKVAAFRVTLDTPNGKKQLEVDPSSSILDAVDAAGVDLPYLCRTGTCGTCASKVMSGKVELVGNHVLSHEQVAAGYVLLCSSFPRSDLTLMTHQEEEMHLSPYQDQH